MSLPFPPYKLETGRPFDRALLRVLYVMTEGLVGRGYRLAVRCVEPVLAGKMAHLIFEDGSLFYFPLADPYWSRLAAPTFAYEPEIAWTLRRLKDVSYTFIDAGANFGFWSVLVSGPTFGAKQALAIEASWDTFTVLERNRRANNERFETFRNAVYDKDNVELGFSAGHHTTRHLTPDAAREIVRTITLDTLAHNAGVDLTRPVVLKLDLEGAEEAALAGGRRVLAGDCMLIYEDHGSDRSHTTTRLALHRLGLKVTFVDTSGQAIAIDSSDRLDRIKRSPLKGYNFFAYRPDSALAI
jgi:FkbM family methyltransferase